MDAYIPTNVVHPPPASFGSSTAKNNQSGTGSPVGIKTPDYVGQGYTDTSNPTGYWTSVGLTISDWVQVA